MKNYCPVCGADSLFLATVNANVSCEDRRSVTFYPSDQTVAYYQCTACDFLFAPDLAAMSPAWFKAHIYNDDYLRYDPDYAGARAALNARLLINAFSFARSGIRHLDYGSGNGLMTERMKRSAFDTTAYDPFNGDAVPVGKFNLITAYEVFEHVPRPVDLLETLISLLDDPGIILFSTLLSDGEVSYDRPFDWWYAAPRNGHISLYSKRSLISLAASNGLHFRSMSPGVHAFWKTLPKWADF